jgi:hypothetical protein
MKQIMYPQNLYQLKNKYTWVKVSINFLPGIHHFLLNTKDNLMNFWAELGKQISQTIRQGRLLINELSDEIGVSDNLLYQNAKYFCDFGGKSPTLENIILCMDRQKDFKILKLICRRFNFTCSKNLAYPKNHETNLERFYELQKRYMAITGLFAQLIKNPIDEIINKIAAAIDECINYEMAILRSLRMQSGQLELFEK